MPKLVSANYGGFRGLTCKDDSGQNHTFVINDVGDSYHTITRGDHSSRHIMVTTEKMLVEIVLESLRKM